MKFFTIYQRLRSIYQRHFQTWSFFYHIPKALERQGDFVGKTKHDSQVQSVECWDLKKTLTPCRNIIIYVFPPHSEVIDIPSYRRSERFDFYILVFGFVYFLFNFYFQNIHVLNAVSDQYVISAGFYGDKLQCKTVPFFVFIILVCVYVH